MSIRNLPRSPWLLLGILVAGALLLTGAIVAGKPVLVAVTVLLVVLTLVVGDRDGGGGHGVKH